MNILSNLIARYTIDIPTKLLDCIPFNNINWFNLSSNPAAIHLLEKYPDKINWDCLSENPAGIQLLEKNLSKINWFNLSSNPAAIHLLEKNPDKIVWSRLSRNPAAIQLLEKNPDKIKLYWDCLSENSAIFEIDNIAYKSLLKYFTELV